jgi:hypothetical protein
MNARAEPEIPCQFGVEHSLFGLYHPASGLPKAAVLLCPPLGQDLIRCHRLYRQLGHALATGGSAVLRFDYYGTGDSDGDSSEVDWQRCVADTVAAAGQLRVRSGCDRIVAFGARLGGSIAIAASDSAAFAELILWDPILDGESHVRRLDALQTALRCDTQRFAAARPASAAANQWQGFRTGADWRQQLTGLRLQPPPRPSLLLHSWPADSGDDRNQFVAAGASVRELSQPTPWDDLARLEIAIQSHELIELARERAQEIH